MITHIFKFIFVQNNLETPELKDYPRVSLKNHHFWYMPNRLYWDLGRFAAMRVGSDTLCPFISKNVNNIIAQISFQKQAQLHTLWTNCVWLINEFVWISPL